ncbi:MAG: carbohydrate kinase family protein [Anaerolineales bacterium]|jgi:sugar/nucleoside kinase (ribokinase family)
MTSKPPALVCVGRIVREMIHFPHEVQGPVLGSPPAYCSVAAARQGTYTGIVTKIGSDMPEALLQPIKRAGVDTGGILLTERSTASELIYDTKGNKEIRYPSMSDPIKQDDVPKSFHGCEIIYVCPMDTDVLLEDLGAVTVLGQRSAVDLGGYGGVHMSKARRQAISSLAEFALDVASFFNIVKASDEDAISIFGEDNPPESAKRLLASGPKVVLITLGEKGVLVTTAENQWLVPPVPGTVTDTTGGGDTFMAGFLSEYLRSQNPVKSAQWGCATAICVIEHGGGVLVERMPTRQQVQVRVDQNYR